MVPALRLEIRTIEIGVMLVLLPTTLIGDIQEGTPAEVIVMDHLDLAGVTAIVVRSIVGITIGVTTAIEEETTIEDRTPTLTWRPP